jgi:hypothetical protein
MGTPLQALGRLMMLKRDNGNGDGSGEGSGDGYGKGSGSGYGNGSGYSRLASGRPARAL